jgi:hypothetical protein
VRIEKAKLLTFARPRAFFATQHASRDIRRPPGNEQPGVIRKPRH